MNKEKQFMEDEDIEELFINEDEEQIMDVSDFKDYLEQDQINKLLTNVVNDYAKSFKEQIIQYLKTTNEVEIPDTLNNEDTDEIYYIFKKSINKQLESFEYNEEIADILSEKDNEFKSYKTYVYSNCDPYFNQFSFLEIFIDWNADECLEMISKLMEYFDYDVIMENIQLNENYAYLFDETDQSELEMNDEYSYEQLERDKYNRDIEESIIHEMPDNIIDLYPLARKIKRHFVLHIGETNSGKTYEAIEALKKSKKGIYLAPLRLLAFEQFDNLNNNRCPCNLITGEEHILVDNAKYQSSTIEMLDMLEEYDVAVIDEAQMLEDKFRGGSWTQAILGIRAHEIHVCAAPKAENILTKMILSCNDTYDIVKHERNTQLIQENELFEFPKDVQKGDALIVFSRTSAHGVANELKNNGIKTSIIYGSLPYDVRQNEAKRFMNGETDVVVATDAIGLGMNLPIRRVVFLEQEKYDGEKRRYLNVSEVTQIAGRAGRYGIFNEGYVNSYNNQKVIYRLLDKKTDDIKECYIGFPESLIGIDAPLSDILKRWKNVNIQDGFKKANIDHELKLVEEADKLTSDKSVIYRFITMPFDDNDSVMMWLWHTMIDNYCKGIHLDFSSLKYKYIKDRDIKDMKSMEEAYKICDMIFCYDERFFNGIDSEEIMKTKHELSEIIIGLLEQSKLSVRKCKHCGKILPWNYPYNMCQECHDIKYSHNYYDYY